MSDWNLAKGNKYLITDSTTLSVEASPPPTPAATASKAPNLAADVRDMISYTVGIYACYIGHGLLQEHIYSASFENEGKKEQFRYNMFLVFAQCLVGAWVAFLTMLIYPQPKNNVPQMEYFKISFSYIGAMLSTNYSLLFVSYPIQALAKCCKLIPVMLMRIIINRTRYKLAEYVNVGLITLGITVFNFFQTGKSGKAVEDSWYGLALLFISLVLDGFTGPNQENIIDKYKPSIHQLMFHMNIWAVGMMSVVLLFTGEIFVGVQFCLRHPSIIASIILYSVAASVGQNFVFFMLFRFNSLVLTIVTTTRKFVTILFSVICYGHTLTLMQWGGVGLVFVGISLNTMQKYSSKVAHHQPVIHHIPGTHEPVAVEEDSDDEQNTPTHLKVQ